MTHTEALQMARGALEIGRDCAAEVAQRLRTELSGYRQHKHDAADTDVAKIDAAIAALDALQSSQPATHTEALRAALQAAREARDAIPLGAERSALNVALDRLDVALSAAAALAQPAASGEPPEPFGYVITHNFPEGHAYRYSFYTPKSIGTAYRDTALSITPVFANAQPVPDAVPLKWAEAPRRTEWGAGMMEALIALGADETLQLYAHRDAVPLVDALLSAQPAPARVPLTAAPTAQQDPKP